MLHLPICVTGMRSHSSFCSSKWKPLLWLLMASYFEGFLSNSSLSTSGYLPYIMLQLVFFSALRVLFVCVCFVYHIVLEPCGWSGSSRVPAVEPMSPFLLSDVLPGHSHCRLTQAFHLAVPKPPETPLLLTESSSACLWYGVMLPRLFFF